MDRIFEATSMSGYGHPLRVSVFGGVVEHVDDDVIVETKRTHCLNLFRLRLPQLVPVVVVVVNVVGIVDDDAPRPLVGDCTSTSWCALVLCETCGCVVVVFSLRLLVGRCTPAAGVYASLDIV